MALEAGGKDLYVAVSRNDNHAQRHYDDRPKSVTERPSKVVKDPRLLAMQEKLKSDGGRALYAGRKHTVQPVFGIIKSVLGFRPFLLRGLEKVTGEWGLVCLAYNAKRLWVLKTACSRFAEFSARAECPAQPVDAQTWHDFLTKASHAV